MPTRSTYLAGALDYRTGQMVPVTGASKNRFLFLDLLKAIQFNGPWVYNLSEIYDTPQITQAVAELQKEPQWQAA